MTIRLLLKNLVLLFLLVTGIVLSAVSQDRCGTVEYIKKLQPKTFQQSKDQFENWMLQKLVPQKTNGNLRTKSGPYKIPVVVHVIHNGEAEGSGTNISDAQILSQLRVLNEDYRRENADQINTPAEFTDEAGSMDIEFILAQSDPEGLATDGIVRVQGTQTSWTVHDNYKLKSLSYWPAENYMNIWVCNITDYLGYAQFPVSNLAGLEGSSNNALTDGVVIYYRAFGSIDDGNFNLEPDYNKGRTSTHEISHFFGLRHIWGDDSGCGTPDDYVADTPVQAGSTSGCPAHPRVTCSTPAMFQNFTDYTDDACMNLFTHGQIDRMQVVIENSPRRKSLLTSPGLNPPAPPALDLGIRTILSPQESSCSTNVTPQLEIRNYGTSNITTAQIRVRVDGGIVDTQDFLLGLDHLETDTVTFAPVNISTGWSEFSFEIVLANGIDDNNNKNDTVSVDVLVPETINVSFLENFNVIDNWSIINPDGDIGWQLANAPKNTPSNQAIMMNFYDYEDKQGEIDILLSPVFSLENIGLASLSFDVAYSQFQSSADRLKVYVIENCQTIDEGVLIFNEGGFSLDTTPGSNSTSDFTPQGPSDWARYSRSLASFLGQTHLQLAFVGVNDWGNKLYLDNIAVDTIEYEDIGIRQVISPGVVTCNEEPVLELVVENNGSAIIQKFTLDYSVNGGNVQHLVFDGLDISPGDDQNFSVSGILLEKVVNTLKLTLLDPNDTVDLNLSDNEKELTIVVNTETERIPWRENFDGTKVPWVKASDTGATGWEMKVTNYDESMSYQAFQHSTNINTQAWLVSPSLDFSRWNEASMTFDVSYRRRAGETADNLEIYASGDCGDTYEKLSYTFDPMAFEQSEEAWTPASEDDWQKQSVALTTFAGLEEVRVAFVVTNRNGNNLYIDNVEFFTTTFTNTIEAKNPYSIYGYEPDNLPESSLNIKFNLPERQTVRFSLVDTMGKTLSTTVLYDVLNQAYNIDTSNITSSGVYIVYLLIGNKSYGTRIFIAR